MSFSIGSYFHTSLHMASFNTQIINDNTKLLQNSCYFCTFRNESEISLPNNEFWHQQLLTKSNFFVHNLEFWRFTINKLQKHCHQISSSKKRHYSLVIGSKCLQNYFQKGNGEDQKMAFVSYLEYYNWSFSYISIWWYQRQVLLPNADFRH